jgi:acetylornithine deacetylase/succinyl-diaminopimelate desuccinylase-like protein
MVLSVLWSAPLSVHAEGPDWLSAKSEAQKILQDLVKIDSANPSGNEIAAAKYLKALFDKADIPTKIIEPQPGRANLIARLKGDKTKRPLILLSQGRGNSDMKSVIAAQAVSMLLFKRMHLPIHRDIIFMSTADEEAGGKVGIQYLLKEHRDEFANAEVAFGEGSRGRPATKDGKVWWVGIQTTEKRTVNLRVVAKGTAGHAMLQKPDNAIYALSRALAKISRYQPPFKPDSTAREFVQQVSKLTNQPPDWIQKLRSSTRESDQLAYSMLFSTFSATMINGGIRGNAIPAQAEAIINARLVPSSGAEALVEGFTRLVDDPQVSIELQEPELPAIPSSSIKNEVFEAFKTVVTSTFGAHVPVIPTVGTGKTDSYYLRAAGIQAYGMEPFVEDRDQNTRKGFQDGVIFYYDLLREIQK